MPRRETQPGTVRRQLEKPAPRTAAEQRQAIAGPIVCVMPPGGDVGRATATESGATSALTKGKTHDDQNGEPDARTAAASHTGLWLLPVYGLLLAVSTVNQQPDVETDFAGYPRYITTGQFLISHLVASIGGAALAVLGVMAAAVFLAAGRARRLALTGAVVTVVANVHVAAAFGSASFVQPGIDRAYLRGAPSIQELNADTAYGPALVATIAAALVVLVMGAILVGTALARTAPGLRWPGISYAVSLTIFSFSGVLGFGARTQPVAGLLLMASTVLLARWLPRVGPRAATVGRELTWASSLRRSS